MALAGLALGASTALAEAPIACAVAQGGAGKVVKIIGPLELQLDDGIKVALSEIGAPPRNKDRPGADIASAVLAREALGKRVTLYFDGGQTDRHGRALAQVWIEGAAEPWLQRLLVTQGAAYVDTWPTNRACAGDLLARESEARSAAHGLWADPANRILSAENAKDGEGRFAIVEGNVVSVTKVSNPTRIYIDFGPDWHTDFSVSIDGAAARLFKSAKIDPDDWKGKGVRVRGYVGWRFGPEIEVQSPEQIELIKSVTARAEPAQEDSE